MIEMFNTGWIVLQLFAMIAFFFWLTCSNEGWGLFLGLQVFAAALLLVTWLGLRIIGIDINDYQWITFALVTWPLVAMLIFQLVNTYKRIGSRVNKQADVTSIETRVFSGNVIDTPDVQPMSASVQIIVERAALVCRKYAFWNTERFAKEFQGIDDSIIRTAWSIAIDSVKDYEVIEVSPRREITQFIGHGIICEVVGKPEYEDDETNFTYLMSKLDDSKLSLVEQDREREIRRLLALRYVIRSRGLAFGDTDKLLGSFVVPKIH